VRLGSTQTCLFGNLFGVLPIGRLQITIAYSVGKHTSTRHVGMFRLLSRLKQHVFAFHKFFEFPSLTAITARGLLACLEIAPTRDEYQPSTMNLLHG
jgi:hypothetical protein